jgi:tetratricopeptide (TPR) repeat protein
LLFFLVPFSGLYETLWIDLLFFLLPSAAFVLLIAREEKSDPPLYAPPGTSAILLLIMIGLVQLVPLPAQLVRILSPETWEIYTETAGVLDPDSWMTLTLEPKITLHAVFSLVSCCAGYFVAANVLADRGRLKIAAMSLAALGGGLGGTVLILRLLNLQASPPGTTLTEPPAMAGDAFLVVTTVMVLVCTISFALFLAERPAIHYGTLQERIADFFANPGQKKHFIFGLPVVVIPLALALYKPGMLAVLAVSILLLLILLGSRSRGRSEVPYLLVYLVLVMILTIFAAHKAPPPSESVGPVASEQSAVSRRVFRDFAVAGSGFGTISSLAPRYRLTTEPGAGAKSVVRGFFHLAAQGGLLSVAALCWLALGFLLRTFIAWRRRRHKLAVYVYAAAFSGLVAYGLCLLSFPFRNQTAFPLLVFLIAGFSAAAAMPGKSSPDRKELRQNFRLLSLGLIFALVFFALYFYMGSLAARSLYGDVRWAAEGGMELSRYRLLRAVRYDPFNPRYRYDLGFAALASGDSRQAREHFARALQLDPLNGIAVYSLAQAFEAQGENAIARNLVSAALKNNPDSREILLGYVSRLLDTNNTSMALESIRSSLEIDPSNTLFWLEYLVSSGFELRKLTRVLPNLSRSWYDYGQYLLQRGDSSGASGAFLQATTLAENEEMPDKTLFLSVARFFEAQQSYEDALDVLLTAGRKFPEEKSFLSSAARIYQEMGITFKAIELYRKILILDPADNLAREQLERLEGGL